MGALAGTLYGARLRVQGRLPNRLLIPIVLLRNAVLGATGLFSDHVAPAVIEVYRLSDGTVVGTVPCDSSYSGQADTLAAVRTGLCSQSHEDFLATSGLQDS